MARGRTLRNLLLSQSPPLRPPWAQGQPPPLAPGPWPRPWQPHPQQSLTSLTSLHTHGHTVSSAHAHDALHAHTLTVLHSHPLRCPAPGCLPQSLPPGRTGTHNPQHHSLHGPQPRPFTQTPTHEDNAWALLPRPSSHVRAPLHNLPRRCSQTDSQMQRARTHTHSPAYIPTTFSHACVHTHILSEPPSHHHFPSSVSHKHSLCQEGGSAAEQPPKCLSLFSITSSLASGSPLPPPDPQTGASYSSVISLLFNNNTQSVHLIHSAYVDGALIMG